MPSNMIGEAGEGGERPNFTAPGPRLPTELAVVLTPDAKLTCCIRVKWTLIQRSFAIIRQLSVIKYGWYRKLQFTLSFERATQRYLAFPSMF
jgi:hypothetical protein